MPGQQCPPNERIWEQGRTTANGFLAAGVDSSQEGRIPSPTESVDTRASEKSTRITADTTFLQQGHKPRSEENMQFDPGGTVEKERRPALERGCNSTFFFWGELGGSLFVLRALSLLCVCSVSYILVFYPGDHFSAKLKDMRGDADQVTDVRNRRATIFSS